MRGNAVGARNPTAGDGFWHHALCIHVNMSRCRVSNGPGWFSGRIAVHQANSGCIRRYSCCRLRAVPVAVSGRIGVPPPPLCRDVFASGFLTQRGYINRGRGKKIIPSKTGLVRFTGISKRNRGQGAVKQALRSISADWNRWNVLHRRARCTSCLARDRQEERGYCGIACVDAELRISAR